MAKTFDVQCPCCQTAIVIDSESGQVLLHREPVKKRAASGSLDAMLSDLEAKKSEIASKFDRELENQKDRGRLLDARFREAVERADKTPTRMPNALDLD